MLAKVQDIYALTEKIVAASLSGDFSSITEEDNFIMSTVMTDVS